MITLLIDKFDGRLTRQTTGTMDSGLVKYATSYGNDPFSNPSSLTWFEAPTQIDPTAAVITDLIVAARPRLESGITYVYAVGHTGRLYKIQVNDPTTYNPNYDNPVLLTTLTSNTPTFKYGSSIQFYGATEKIYIGHDKGVTSVNYDGSGEAFVGVLGTWTQNVPRPSVNFIGITYWGNGTNIAAIDSTATVTTYTKLAPAFPIGTFVRDLDISPDGTYLQAIVSRLNSPDLTSATQDTTSLSSTDSYRFLWNGIDLGYTSFESYSGYSINSNISYGQHSYTMGYDLGGAAIYAGASKIISLPNSVSPNFESMFSTGNLMGFGAPEQDTSVLKGSLLAYGQYDSEVPLGLFRFFRKTATAPETDIIQMPVCLTVSNLFKGSSAAGYSNNQIGSAKIYFSTLETSSAPTTKYRFYKFTTVPTGLGTAIAGVYETQNQTSIRLFRNILRKKLQVKEVRVYTQSLVTNNAFTIDIIGRDGTVIAGTTKTFTVGTNATVGDDFVQYNPVMAPSHSIGLRITNVGTANWVCDKVELDIDEAGK